jgi:hypothetical protein
LILLPASTQEKKINDKNIAASMREKKIDDKNVVASMREKKMTTKMLPQACDVLIRELVAKNS